MAVQNSPINLTEAIRLANEATNSRTMYPSEKVVAYDHAIETLLDAVDRLEAAKADELKKAIEHVRRKTPPSSPPNPV